MAKTRFLFPLAVLVLLPRMAFAWDFSVKGLEFTLDATNTFQYTYRFDNDNNDPVDDEYHHFFNTLDVTLSSGDLRLGGRFDLNVFADTFFSRSCSDPNGPDCTASARRELNSRFQNQLVAERIYLIVARPEFDLTLGDFYVSFGKGMALNVVKIGELSQDNAIRGGKFVLHQGDIELTFVGGEFNTLNLDEPTGKDALWDTDPVVGLRLSYNILGTVIAGAHGVFIPISPNTANSSAPAEPGYHHLVFGAGVEVNDLFDDRLNLAAEVDFQQTVDGGVYRRGSSDQWLAFEGGTALYANGSLQLGDLTILGEFKYYDDFDLAARTASDEPFALRYHQPPTLEWLRAEISNNVSVSGFRTRLDYNFGELGPLEVLAFINFGYFKNWDNGQGKGDREVINPMAGAEATWADGTGQAQISAGLRREMDIDKDLLYLQDTHIEVGLEQGIVSNHSASLTGLFLLRRVEGDPSLLEVDEDWAEIELSLSYKWSPHVAVSLTYERQGRWDTKQADFVGGGVKYFITPATYVNARFGQNRPGVKCISGTCRYFPAFSGAQLILVGRFSDLNKWLN